MIKEIKKNNLQYYSKGITDIINVILILSAMATLWVLFVRIYWDNGNSTVIIINLSIFIISITLFIFKSRVPREVKASFLILAGVAQSGISLLKSGNIGTGLLVIIVVQVIILIIVDGKRAIFYSSLGLIPIIFATILVFSSNIRFIPMAYNQSNTVEIWFINLSNAIIVYSIIAYSITKLKTRLMSQIETIDKLANLDELTGFANKNYFIGLVNKTISYEIKQEKNKTIYLFLVRLENFRLIDSMYGHSQGDSVIKEIADIIPKIVNEGAIFGRYSGSEFVVFSRSSGKEIIDKLEYHLDKMFPDMNLPITLVQVEYPRAGSSTAELISNLEITVKVGKENITENFIEFSPSYLTNLTLEKEMQYLLQKAVRNREFYVAYQHKVTTDGEFIHGVEALARWKTPEMGQVSPDKFIPVLHKYNLMVDFSMVIIDKILSEYHILEKKLGRGLKISINISPTLFLFSAFQRYILYTLKEYKVDTNVVVLEITEEVLMDDLGDVARIVKELKEVGIEVALDDFGKGFSSLNYLQFVDFSEIKIDKSFVDNIVHDAKSRSLISAICRIGKDLNMRIVCEGVETKEQMETLREMDCDLIQGYLFSKPYSLNE